MMKIGKRTKAIALAILIAAAAAGCGNGADYDSAATAPAYESQKASGNGADSYGEYDYDDASYEASDDVYSEEATETAGADSGSVTVEEGADTKASTKKSNRKLIRTIDMSVETEQFDELVANVTAKTNTLGGYIETSNIWEDNYYGNSGTQQKQKHASFSFRIPKDQMDLFITMVEGGTNVTHKQESMDDVTLTYVDIESHKKALQTEQDRLLELLAQAEDMDVILTIENRLTEIRYQVQSMESQLRTYDDQVDYSTLKLEVTEVVRYTPVVEDKSAWTQMKTGFMNSLYSVARGLLNFFIWFVVHIPQLIIWAVIIFILVLIVKKIRKKKSANPSKRQLKREAKRQKKIDAMRKKAEANGMAVTTDSTEQNETMPEENAGQESTAESDKE